MRILINQHHPREQHLVLHFGLGLIGSAISSALLRLDFKLVSNVHFEWTNNQQFADALKLIDSICFPYSENLNHLSIVWSAGKSGFYSSQDEVDGEFDTFRKSLEFISELKRNLQPTKFSFHFVSSAGGLFEGQRIVHKSSVPSPLRPYGRLKLRQEEALQSTFDSSEVLIYRPSSVYGPMTQKSRLGLINNLINNARSGHVTVLDAHVMSLRDYVFTGDIGQYIARKVRFAGDNEIREQTRFLVSAKCSSIFEVFTKIRRILNLHAQFRYDDQFGNHKNITFSDNVMPSNWRPVALDVGIRQFMIGR